MKKVFLLVVALLLVRVGYAESFRYFQLCKKGIAMIKSENGNIVREDLVGENVMMTQAYVGNDSIGYIELYKIEFQNGVVINKVQKKIPVEGDYKFYWSEQKDRQIWNEGFIIDFNTFRKKFNKTMSEAFPRFPKIY